MKSQPTELHCYQPRKPESNCDQQLTLNLRNSIEWVRRCDGCNGLTYTKFEKRRGLCYKCQSTPAV